MQLAQEEIVPDIRMKMARHPDPKEWWWQQDLAPAHEKKPRKIKFRASRQIFPHGFQKGADCSPLDYCIWGRMDNKLSGYRQENEIKNEDDLTTALMSIRAQIPQSLVDSAIDSFRRRVDMMIEAAGGHFEHMKK